MTVFGIMFFLFAGMAGDSILKEDLQVIHKYQSEHKAADLAQRLQLNPKQVETLKAVRSEVDKLREQRDQAKRSFEKGNATFVKEVRRVYEAGETPSQDQMDRLKEMRKQHRIEGKRFKMSMQMAALSLEGFLTSEQQAELRKISKQQRKGPQFRKDEKPEARSAMNRKKGPGAHQGRKHWTRVLLSDAFLKAV